MSTEDGIIGIGIQEVAPVGDARGEHFQHEEHFHHAHDVHGGHDGHGNEREHKPVVQTRPTVVHNKVELVAGIAERAGITKADAERWLNALNEFTVEALGRGEMIKLTGLYEVMRVKRAARIGRNLQTGQELAIPESWGVRFRPGSMLKNAVKY